MDAGDAANVGLRGWRLGWGNVDAAHARAGGGIDVWRTGTAARRARVAWSLTLGAHAGANHARRRAASWHGPRAGAGAASTHVSAHAARAAACEAGAEARVVIESSSAASAASADVRPWPRAAGAAWGHRIASGWGRLAVTALKYARVGRPGQAGRRR